MVKAIVNKNTKVAHVLGYENEINKLIVNMPECEIIDVEDLGKTDINNFESSIGECSITCIIVYESGHSNNSYFMPKNGVFEYGDFNQLSEEEMIKVLEEYIS